MLKKSQNESNQNCTNTNYFSQATTTGNTNHCTVFTAVRKNLQQFSTTVHKSIVFKICGGLSIYPIMDPFDSKQFTNRNEWIRISKNCSTFNLVCPISSQQWPLLNVDYHAYPVDNVRCPEEVVVEYNCVLQWTLTRQSFIQYWVSADSILLI